MKLVGYWTFWESFEERERGGGGIYGTLLSLVVFLLLLLLFRSIWKVIIVNIAICESYSSKPKLRPSSHEVIRKIKSSNPEKQSKKRHCISRINSKHPTTTTATTAAAAVAATPKMNPPFAQNILSNLPNNPETLLSIP
jgi:hypothetical protein